MRSLATSDVDYRRPRFVAHAELLGVAETDKDAFVRRSFFGKLTRIFRRPPAKIAAGGLTILVSVRMVTWARRGSDI